MLKVEIGTIDMDGYCGRDNHPEASDGGQIAEVVSVETIEEDDDLDVYNDDLDNDDKIGGKGSYTEQIYTVALNDGRTVELVEHEIKRIWIDNA